MNRLSRPRTIALLAALALLGSACGSSTEADDDVVAQPSAATTTEAVETLSPTPTPTPPLSPSLSPTPTATPSPTSPPTAAPSPSPTPSASPTPAPINTPTYLTGVEPVRLEIPAIGVDADVVDLAIGPGDPEVPEAWEDAGWYTTTRDPGEIGPSVIAGHIDSKSGPAVFYRLNELTNGDEIIVHDEDGESRTFTVRDAGQYPKENLPDEVFGFGQRRPELRLITCGGSFDTSFGHYEDNLVVYAAQDV